MSSGGTDDAYPIPADYLIRATEKQVSSAKDEKTDLISGMEHAFGAPFAGVLPPGQRQSPTTLNVAIFVIFNSWSLFRLLIDAFLVSRRINIGFSFVLKSCGRYVWSYMKARKTYEQTCGRDIVYLIASYGCEPEIHALKEFGNRVFEYQHGVLYPEHFGYNMRVGKEFSNKLPIPDIFFVYDEFSKQSALKGRASRIDGVHAIGHFSLSQALKSDWKYTRDIVFYSQPGFLDRQKNINFLRRLKAELGMDASERIFVLPHPREDASVKLPDDFCYIDTGLKLNESRQVITCSPSIFYERLLLDLPCIYFTHQVWLGNSDFFKHKFPYGYYRFSPDDA